MKTITLVFKVADSVVDFKLSEDISSYCKKKYDEKVRVSGVFLNNFSQVSSNVKKV